MRRRSGIATLAALGLLCACGQQEGRGGLTAEEDRELDNAAAMLEDNTSDASPDSLDENAQALEAMDTETDDEAENAVNAQ